MKNHLIRLSLFFFLEGNGSGLRNFCLVPTRGRGDGNQQFFHVPNAKSSYSTSQLLFKTLILVLKKLSDYGAPYSLFKMLQLGWVIFLSTFSQWRSYQYKGRNFCYHLSSNPGQSQAIHFHRLKDYSFSRNKSTFSFLLALQMTLIILLSRTLKIHRSKDRSEDELK